MSVFVNAVASRRRPCYAPAASLLVVSLLVACMTVLSDCSVDAADAALSPAVRVHGQSTSTSISRPWSSVSGSDDDASTGRHRGGETGFVRASGTQLVGPDGTPITLRGINLGNWILQEGYMFDFDVALAPWQIRQVTVELLGQEAANAFWQTYLDTFITGDDLDFIRQTGMNALRLPFDYRYFTVPEYPDVWLDRGFALLDRVVSFCRSAGMYVLIDMHAAPCGQTGENIDNSNTWPFLFADDQCLQRTAAVWSRIAARYANETAVLGYDLLNEPIPPYPEYLPYVPRLQIVYQALARAIRAVDPHHVLFLGGAAWDSSFDCFTQPNFDPNLVYTFHKYWTAADISVIQSYLDFRQRYQVPIFCGESGENSDEWVRNFTQTLNGARVDWTFWTYKKLNSSSCMRTYATPPYWDEIVAYQKLFGASFADKRAARPPADHVQAAFGALLKGIAFDATAVNAGFIQALGMTVPPETR